MTTLERPCAGSHWRNRHTGRNTVVLAVRDVVREEPHALAQDPRDGRLLFGDYRPVEQVWVYFEGGAPPGFDDHAQGGWSLSSFLEHWNEDIGGYGGES